MSRHARALSSATLFLFSLSGSAALADSILVIDGPLPGGVAEQLTRSVSFYGDYGSLAVAEGDRAALARIRALGLSATLLEEWRDELSVHISDAEHVPASARVLYRSDDLVLSVTTDGQVLFGCAHHRTTVQRRPFSPSGFVQPTTRGTGKAVTVDPRIAAMVAQVNQANLLANVTQLSSYHTRRSDQPQATQAKNWLVSQFQAIPGLTVSTDTFNGSYVPNIIAELPGTTHPDRLVVLGAHYDSLNGAGSTAVAPGADDNASGSSGILETARILSQHSFENTVRFVLFSAEEFGLVGAYNDADDLVAAGANVVGMLNMDMNAYRQNGDTRDLDLATNNTSASLTQLAIDVTNAYLPGFPVVTGSLSGGTSDHQAYHSRGFPAAFFFEDLGSYSPYIHGPNDTVGTSANDFLLSKQIVQAFVATAATLAEPVDLEITHTPVADSEDAGGPYPLTAIVTSLTSETVSGVDLYYRVDGGSLTQKALIASATPDEWLGSVPGIAPGSNSGTLEYYLLATDSGGNQSWSPDAVSPGGALHSFTVGSLSSIFADDFEGAGQNGWTTVQVATQNDWQKGTPQGKGGYDPSTAASGSNARGNDLGIGNYNGIYQSNVNNYLQSPNINCAGQSGVRLRYQRWLSVEDGYFDQASVKVNGQTVWQNPATPGGGTNHTIDSAWTPQDLDISALADNNPSVSLRFQLQSDGGLEFGGWTLDDVELFTLDDGNVPPLVADEVYVPSTTPSTVSLQLDAGAAHGNEKYVLFVSATGTSPPTVLNGVQIPLVIDQATLIGLGQLNGAVFQDFLGVLTSAGEASPTINLPGSIDPNLPGTTLYFAAFTYGPVTWASNPIAITFGM